MKRTAPLPSRGRTAAPDRTPPQLEPGEAHRLALWITRMLVNAGIANWILRHDGRMEPGIWTAAGMPQPEAQARRRTLLRKLEQRLEGLERVEACGAQGDDGCAANAATFATVLGLDEVERDVLLYTASCYVHGALARFVDDAEVHSRRQLARLLATAFACPVESVEESLGAHGRLRDSGLLWLEHYVRRGLRLELTDDVAELLVGPPLGPEGLFQSMAPEAAPASLSLEAYPHLSQDLDVLCPYLRQTLERSRPGANVLVHGPPGTGKTELARTIAKHAGVRLYEVRCKGADGGALDGTGRLRHYAALQRLLRSAGGALVAFDEIEDVFPTRLVPLLGLERSTGHDKAFINRLLETNAAPTIWISNQVRHVDPAFLRRFDYTLHVRSPPRSVRRELVRRRFARQRVRDEWVDRVAGEQRLTPAAIDRAARVVELLDHSEPAELEAGAERVLASALGRRDGRIARRPHDEGPRYELSFVRTSVDLAALAGGLGEHGRGTVLLHGAPGTGKTAYARHVAKRLDRPLVSKTGSDLLSCWVGDTEKNIEAMFEQARDEQAVLLLDEADSFLRSRDSAHHSWEVSQTNELLVQMERFEGVFFCATNALEALDRASLRRFAVKVRFDPPGPDARWRLFQAALEQLGIPPARGRHARRLRGRLETLSTVTPGDFAAAIHRARITTSHPSAAWLLQQLEEEQQIKPDVRAPIGFVDRG